jgi:hypothetical protein
MLICWKDGMFRPVRGSGLGVGDYVTATSKQDICLEKCLV